jgi:hypothetical protein
MHAISNNTRRPVDVDPQHAAVALDRLDPLRPLRDALIALGFDHRVAIRPIHTGASKRSVSVGISWSLPGDSRAQLTWTASVDPSADNRSLLSCSVQAGANDANGRQRLLAAWPSIGPVFESLTARPTPSGLYYRRPAPHAPGTPLAVTPPLARQRSLTT